MELPIPSIPNEIVSEILSYLGKNYLLKCRLVSQSWNGLSSKILRNPKYGHEHELTQDNIKKFLEFSNDRTGEWVLPFHLNFGHSELEESVAYDQIPNSIQQLKTIFGTQCVVGLTLSHNSSSSLESVKVLISILTLIAPSLTHLNLSQFKLRLQDKGETKKIEEMLSSIGLDFLPNLSKLRSCPSPTWLNEDGMIEILGNKDNLIHVFLLINSEDLTELEVKNSYDLIVMDVMGDANQIPMLKKLTIVDVVKNYRLCFKPILTSLKLRVLNDLSITHSTADNYKFSYENLNELLSSLSTSLQSLTVRFNEIPTNPFPRLVNLTSLRIQVQTPASARIQVDPRKLNLNSEAFPVLDTLDISTNIYFESTHVNSRKSKDDDWILGTVKSLRIRVMNSQFDQIDFDGQDEDGETIFRASAKNYVDHLQNLFPNVTSLTLVNESDGHDEYLNQLLNAFVQSDRAPKIKELETQNCDKNYLGHILNGLDPDRQPRLTVTMENMELDEEFLKSIKKAFQGYSGGSELILSIDQQMGNGDAVALESKVITCKAPIIHLKMTGLEKIRMSVSKNVDQKSGQSGCEQKSNQNDLFLMSLPKHLPLLRQIDISQRMFGEDQDFCKQQTTNVHEKFPDLVINLTH